MRFGIPMMSPPFELCRDSQTQWIVGKLKAHDLNGTGLLDYGCGNLRLLNAVHEAGLLSNLRYVATDITPPTLTYSESLSFVFKDAERNMSLTCGEL